MGRHRHSSNPPSKGRAPEQGQVRIIGGQWRGRKLGFPIVNGLRPTGDRVRETLFNWLAPHIEGARCLDAFAGSGALGLEALSRGAAHCQFLDAQRSACDAIRSNLSLLACSSAQVSEASALSWLPQCSERFDIVFIDPPFADELYQPVFSLLQAHELIHSNSLIYVESDRRTPMAAPAGFAVLKDKTAGQTRYQLWQLAD